VHPAEAIHQRAPTEEHAPSGARALGGIATGLLLITYLAVSDDVFAPLLTMVHEHHWTMLVVRPTVLWAAMATTMLAVRSVLWIRYRPDAPADPASAPPLTVVIPAFNEGKMVRRAIESVVAALYPPGRLQIIAVDDGSTDSTWEHIEAAAARHPELVTALRLKENRGKRAALAEGFVRATGEVVVTMDSDSVIDRHALLSIVGPFRRPRVGAVAGKVAVLNREEGIIPRMLAIRFLLTFDMMRAVQSTYGTVYCCPGALTAYRTDVVRRVLDRWTNQTFLGAPCTIGEDRAMTNLVFREGFDAVYQRTAVVSTVVPTTYGQLCRMFLRWDRSHVREEIGYIALLGHRPWVSRIVSTIDTLVNNLRYPVAWASLGTLLVLSPTHPLVLVRLAFAIGFFAGLNMLYCLHSERSLQVLYGILFAYFSFVALFWIFPYAIVTVRARGWLTR
jgi:hyaluronan synthase